MNRFSVSPGQMIEPVNDQCVETEQARFNSQYCIVESSPRSLQRQVVSDCLKNVASIIPATNERFDDASDAHANPDTEGSIRIDGCLSPRRVWGWPIEFRQHAVVHADRRSVA